VIENSRTESHNKPHTQEKQGLNKLYVMHELFDAAAISMNEVESDHCHWCIGVIDLGMK